MGPSQAAALRRDAVQPQQPRAFAIIGQAVAFVPCARAAQIASPARWDIGSILESLEVFTAGQPLDIPIPSGPDQSLALRRTSVPPQQMQNFAIATPPAVYVPPPPFRIGAAAQRQEVALLLGALEIFTPGAPLDAPIPSGPDQSAALRRIATPPQQPATYQVQGGAPAFIPAPRTLTVWTARHDEAALILEQMPERPIAQAAGFVPRGLDALAPAYRRPAYELPRIRAQIAAILAPPPITASERGAALRTLLVMYQDRTLTIEPSRRALVVSYLERELAIVAANRSGGPAESDRTLH
jgi:hypothetical protein